MRETLSCLGGLRLRRHKSFRLRSLHGFTFNLDLCLALWVQKFNTTIQSFSRGTLICQQTAFMPPKTQMLQTSVRLQGVCVSSVEYLFIQLSSSARLYGEKMCFHESLLFSASALIPHPSYRRIESSAARLSLSLSLYIIYIFICVCLCLLMLLTDNMCFKQ